MMYCSFPKCKADSAPQLDGIPICSRHAEQVYLAVSDLAKRVTLAQRIATAPPAKGTAKPGYSARPGVVYFARFGYLIKIGFTTSIKDRMRALRPDEVLATMPGTMSDEKALHRRFHRLRERDEMFLPGPELTDYIARLKAAA